MASYPASTTRHRLDTWNSTVPKPLVSPSGDPPIDRDASGSLPKVLYLGGAHGSFADIRSRLGDEVEVIEVSSPVRALSQLAKGEFSAVYCDAEHFAQATDVGSLLRNDRILQGIPDGVVLLDSENTILWGNGRLSEWCGKKEVVGENFYRLLGTPEILGPDFCPFHTALSTHELSDRQSILSSPCGAAV